MAFRKTWKESGFDFFGQLWLAGEWAAVGFLQLLKTVLCVSCDCRVKGERADDTAGVASLLFPPLTDVLWGCVYGVIEGRWGRLFVRLRKHGGQQEHLIVAKPFEDKPGASFTASRMWWITLAPGVSHAAVLLTGWRVTNVAAPWHVHVYVTGRGHTKQWRSCVFLEGLYVSMYDADCLWGLIRSHCSWSPLHGSESVVWGYWRTALAVMSHMNLSQSRIHGTCRFALQIPLEFSHLLPSWPIAHFCFFQPEVTLLCNQDSLLHGEKPCTSQHRGISWDYSTCMPFPNCAAWAEFFGFWLDTYQHKNTWHAW